MIEVMIQNLRGGLSEKTSGVIFHDLIVALVAGSVGFLTFFSTLILIKIFDHLIGHIKILTIDKGDILLSAIGFLCLFLISYLQSFSKKAR